MYGPVSVAFFNVTFDAVGEFESALYIARFRKGNKARTFFGSIDGSGFGLNTTRDEIAIAIKDAMTEEILDFFFDGDQTLTVTIKSAEEFRQAADNVDLFVFMVDIVLAVK